MDSVLLICGHGGSNPYDSGAVNKTFNLHEATLVRELCSLVAERLKRFVKVSIYDPTKNCYREQKEGHLVNFRAYDYVLEFHFNAYKPNKAYGCEVLIHPTETGHTVEDCIVDNVSSVLGTQNRGVKVRSDLLNMNICKGNMGTSYALIEVEFIDNDQRISAYLQKKEAVADAIAKGIVEGFGKGKYSSVSTEPTVDELVSKLNELGILSDVVYWKAKATDDTNIYWLMRKAVNYINQHI